MHVYYLLFLFLLQTFCMRPLAMVQVHLCLCLCVQKGGETDGQLEYQALGETSDHLLTVRSFFKFREIFRIILNS